MTLGDALSNAAIVAGVMVAVLKLLDWLIRDPVKKRMRDATERLYVVLDDMDWGGVALGAFLVAMCIGVIAAIADMAYFNFLLPSPTGIELPDWVFRGDTVEERHGLRVQFVVVHSIASLFTAFFGMGFIASSSNRPMSTFQVVFSVVALIVGALRLLGFNFLAHWYSDVPHVSSVIQGFSHGSGFIALAALSMLAAYALGGIAILVIVVVSKVLHFVVLRLAESKDGPVLALSALLVALGALAKALAGE